MTTQFGPATFAPRLEGAAASPYTAPFSVPGSCVLSEDYFLTDQVIMNSADVVRPFVRADGTVEALLLSGWGRDAPEPQRLHDVWMDLHPLVRVRASPR